MAPTICSDKKRQLRAGHASVRNSTAAAHMSSPASTIVNYVAKGALNRRTAATLRVRSVSAFHNGRRGSGAHSSSDTDDVRVCRDRLLQRGSSTSSGFSSSTATHFEPQQQQQFSNVSDEVHMVTSSTHDGHSSSSSANNNNNNNITRYQQDITSTAALAAYRRSASPNSSVSGSPYQYSSEEEEEDAEDAEVHSINSAMCSEDNGGDTTDDSVGRRQLLRCSLKTVFNAHAPSQSDKRAQTCGGGNINSQTYSNMCEIKNTEGLLAIAIKTINLVKRNQMLQKRLAQLQLETSEFIQSVMANPENRHFREKMQTKAAQPQQPKSSR